VYYPAMLNLKNKKCAVIGGGSVAFRKCLALLECDALVKVVSPVFQEDFNELDPMRVSLVSGIFEASYVEDCFLVIAATGEKEINREIYNYCEKNRILVNIVDEPELCSFIAPAFLQRGDLVISVSTGGKAPALAKKIKEDISKTYPVEYAEYVKTMGLIRAEILKKGFPPQERMKMITELSYLSHEELTAHYENILNF